VFVNNGGRRTLLPTPHDVTRRLLSGVAVYCGRGRLFTNETKYAAGSIFEKVSEVFAVRTRRLRTERFERAKREFGIRRPRTGELKKTKYSLETSAR